MDHVTGNGCTLTTSVTSRADGSGATYRIAKLTSPNNDGRISQSGTQVLSLSQIQSVHIRKERVKDCEGGSLILQKSFTIRGSVNWSKLLTSWGIIRVELRYSNINEIEARLLKHRLLMRRRNASNVLLGWLTPTVQCHTSHRHRLQPRVRNLTSFHSFYCCPAVLQFYCAPVSN